MTLMIEREVKLRFDNPDQARALILASGRDSSPLPSPPGGRAARYRDETLRRRRCVLRIRTEAGKSLLTFKGPVQPGA